MPHSAVNSIEHSGLAWEPACVYFRRLAFSLAIVFLTASTTVYWSGNLIVRSSSFAEPDWALGQLKGRLLGPPGQRNFISGPLVFIGNTTTAARLGCPVDHCGCFFRFSGEAQHTQRLHSWKAADCSPNFRPIRHDKGRPWCLCEMPQPAWLIQVHPAPWRHIKRALVMGHLDGPNPTHVVNVHFFWIWLWLVHVVQLAARQVNLLLDAHDVDASLGCYGEGLARALLSEPVCLPQEQVPLVIGQAKFSLGGTWPFARWEEHQWMQPSPGYMHMVAQVKAHYRLQGQELDHPLRVVIAQRPGNHDQAQRVLTNAAELAASLQERGMQTQIVDFGALGFHAQLQAVHGAAALVGVSGSDLVNGIFLPRKGAVVEISPASRGHAVVNIELHNVMRLAGRAFHRYSSPLDAHLLMAANGRPMGGTLLKQMGRVQVDVPSCTAAVESAVMQAAFEQTDRVGWEWGSRDPVHARNYSSHGHARRAVSRLWRRSNG